MTIEAAIQQRWGDDVALAALVPVERVFASFAPADVVRPAVVVERRKSKSTVRGSGNFHALAVELVFVVEAESYDVAAAIAAAVAEWFDDSDFDAGEGNVVAMRRSEETRQRSAQVGARPEGVRWELRYELMLCSNT